MQVFSSLPKTLCQPISPIGLHHMNGTIQTPVIRIQMWWRISSVYLTLSGSTLARLCSKVCPHVVQQEHAQ